MKIQEKSGIYTISTIKATDRDFKVYETAYILDGKVKVKEIYETEEEALEGHKKHMEYAKTMSEEEFMEFEDALYKYPINWKMLINTIINDLKAERNQK